MAKVAGMSGGARLNSVGPTWAKPGGASNGAGKKAKKTVQNDLTALKITTKVRVTNQAHRLYNVDGLCLISLNNIEQNQTILSNLTTNKIKTIHSL